MSDHMDVQRPQAYISQFGTTLLHLKHPFIVAFWSFAFPGCGHLMQGRLIKGLLLICWELIVNTNAKVNLSIMYSLQGHFDMAKQVLDTRWFLLYVGLYVFAMWDSYRGTVDMNKLTMLAKQEDAPIEPLVIRAWDTNFLDRRNPWFAAALSLLTPGLGYLYLHKVIMGLFFIGWTIFAVVMSHGLESVNLTMVGKFNQAKSVLDKEWLMYLPSIYGFVLHDSYVTTLEYNKLFRAVQSKFLRNQFQNSNFRMPV